MRCKTCGHEIAIPSNTIKVKELKIDVEVNVHDKGKKLSEIEIPKGWRLLTINEVIFLANSEHAQTLKMDLSSSQDDFFFEQPFECNRNKGYIAWFCAYSGGAGLVCGGGPRNSGSALGVRFCRDVKK